MKKYHPLKELLLCRVRLFFREPDAIFWTYGFPLIMIIGLGIAFRNRPPEQTRVAVEDGPAAAQAVEVLAARSADFAVERLSPASCSERLRLGKVDIVVQPDAAGYAYRFDPSRPESTVARARVDAALQEAAGRHDAVVTADKLVTEPGSRYIDFLVPGLLGMNLMGGGLWGLGFITVDMRVRKLLKRLVASPMRRRDLLFSLIGGRMLLVVPELIVILLAAVLIFKVHISGALVNIAALGFLGALCFAGLGLLVASRAQKMETVMGLMNLIMLPMWLFSGIFFSYERFPAAFHPFIRALPLTQLNDALRAVILEGQGLGGQWFAVGYLAAIAVVSFTLALRWFRWS